MDPAQGAGGRDLESSEIFIAGENERAFKAVDPRPLEGIVTEAGSDALYHRSPIPGRRPHFML
jgi:hypothetical protein